MRVAFVITKLFGGGAENRARRTAVHLARWRAVDELLVITREPQNDQVRSQLSSISSLRLKEIPRQRRWDLGHLAGIKQELRRFQPAVVHAWQIQDLYWALAARPPRCALVGSLLNSGLADEANGTAYPPPLYLKVAISFRFAHLIMVNSQVAIDNWSRLARLPKCKFRLIPNLVAFEPPPPMNEAERRRRREQMGIPPDGVVALSVARFHLPMKGQDMALKAMAELSRRYPQLMLLLAGDGPSRREVEELHHKLGLGERARLLGWVDRPNELVALADFFLLPSRTEGFPNALVEAMAMGVPVVATAVGAVPEILRQGRRGILAHPSPEGIAKAVEKMLQELPLWREIAQRQAEEIRQEYGPENIIPRLMELYREAIQLAGANPS